MRTKTLILSVLLGAVGAFSTMAQTNVFSLNAVGYVNTTCPPGFSIVANPLNTTNNTVVSLIPTPPVGSKVYKFVGGVFQIATFGYFDDNGDFQTAWDNPALNLAPGDGVWFKNSAVTNHTITWVGEVMQGSVTNPILAGFNLKGSIIPQAGALDTVLNYPPTTNDVVYLFRGGVFQISHYGYFDDNGDYQIAWDSIPSPNVSEGFWIKTANAKNWTRTFSVNN